MQWLRGSNPRVLDGTLPEVLRCDWNAAVMRVTYARFSRTYRLRAANTGHVKLSMRSSVRITG